MVKLNKPFPFFLNSDRGNFILILLISAFTFTFMEVFKPFGTDPAMEGEVPVYTAITFLVLCFNILVLPRIATNYLDNCDWTLKKYIWFNVYNVASVSLMISISHYFTRDMADCPPIYISFFVDLWKTAAIGIFPLVWVTFMLENRLLNQALKAGDEATTHLQEFRKQNTGDIEGVTTIQSETKESMQLDVNQFLFAQAENNYSELHWENGTGVDTRLMRMSLKNLEDQISNNHILRCHRSFLVNLKKVNEVSGNANGYRLHMESADEGIPVSRTLGKEILERINDMSMSAA